MKAEDIEGYRGKEDIDAILSFIEAEVRTQISEWDLHVNDTYDWEMQRPFEWYIQMAQLMGILKRILRYHVSSFSRSTCLHKLCRRVERRRSHQRRLWKRVLERRNLTRRRKIR